MNQKELLYIEDVLGQAEFMQKKCRHGATVVQDQNLKQIFENIANKHKVMLDNFYQLLNQ